ncbi:MAG: M48 family metalloprotease [Candidatus Krumholzibacteria bacterium]|nr:M48 family metalloprotease [Candidatus Krumholzibacteria bacterium]
MTIRKAISFVSMILIFILIPVSCAINPVTGKRELMLVTEQDEIALGKQSDEEIGQTYGFYEDAALSEYVNRIGQSLARNTQRPNVEYHFKVLDTSIINAFAVPGGYVYVTRGILAYLNDEAELAGVIGHELGHENARHIARQMSRQQLAQLGLNVGMAVSENLRKYAGLANLGASMLFLKFSRDDERQADDLGVEYGSKTGYDTYQMAAFFETLDRLSAGSSTGLPDWFSTHPNPVNRVASVKSKTAEWRQKLTRTQYAVNRNDYLNKVNGIVYGDDPRQGYVEGNAFYHPTMKFTFPIPSGWQVNNTPAQVQIVSEKQDAVILLAQDKATSISTAADQFIEDAKATVQSREKVKVNGFQAEKVVARVISDEDTLRTMSYFIAKGNAVYAFHGLTKWNQFSQYSAAFSKTMSGFKTLDDASKINVKPQLLVVKTATKAGSVGTTLRQLGTSDTDLEQRTILNGMRSTDNLTAGTLIKTIAK